MPDISHIQLFIYFSHYIIHTYIPNTIINHAKKMTTSYSEIQSLLMTIEMSYPDLTAVTSTKLVEYIKRYQSEQSKHLATPAKKVRKEPTTNDAGDYIIHFGKHQGHTIKQITKTFKGKNYIKWLMKQQWMTEERYPDMFKAVRKWYPYAVPLN